MGMRNPTTFLGLTLLLAAPACLMAANSQDFKEGGMALYRAGQYAKALDYFNNAVQADPNDWQAYEDLGDTYSKMDDLANAKNAYQKYIEIYHEDRWQALVRLGARTQRLLWASTGTKNPNYSDVIYVEELIGPDTVNTMPPATLEAFRDHGRARLTLARNVEEAISIMDLVEQIGIPFKELTDKLLDDGVKQFTDAFGKLLKAVGRNGKGTDHDQVEFLRLELMKGLYQEQHHR